MKKFNVIDLFSGCGGFSEGFMQTQKFRFLAHIEWEKPMVDTLRENLIKRWNYSKEKAEERVIQFDIQKTDELINGNLSEEDIKLYPNNSIKFLNKGLKGIVGSEQVDIIIGGPPCQAYSIAGRAQDSNSMKNDYRNYLFESFVKVVSYFKPKLFVFENVPGILSAKPGNELVINRIYKAFEEIGYIIRKPSEMKHAIFSSVNFEVPQDRKRVILIGVKKENEKLINKFYENLKKQKSNKIRTVYDAIKDMPKFEPLEKPYKNGNKNVSHVLRKGEKKISLHEARYNSIRDINIFKTWLSKSMNSVSNKEKLKFYYEQVGKKTNHNKYRNLEWNKPSPTIVSHLYKDGLMFIHPDIEQLRTITIREAALLQSFPIDYYFIGSSAYCFKMIGNAVPVLFSRAIALSIVKLLEEKNNEKIKCSNCL